MLKPDRPDESICLANCASSLKIKPTAKTTAKFISGNTKKVIEYATRHARNGGGTKPTIFSE